MKSRLMTSLLIVGGLMLPLAAHAADDRDKDRSSPSAFVKDSVITTKIKAELAAKKLSSAVHIKVDTDNNGAVLLSGNARTRAEADRAAVLARDVKGVTSVENKIQVKADL